MNKILHLDGIGSQIRTRNQIQRCSPLGLAECQDHRLRKMGESFEKIIISKENWCESYYIQDIKPLGTPLDETPVTLAVGPPVETAPAVGAVTAVEFEFSPGAIGAVVRAGIMPSRF